MIELLVVTMMIAIMSAIVGPGMLGFLARSKISSAQGDIQSVLQETQRGAIKNTATCSITLPPTGSKASDNPDGRLSISSSCLATGVRELEGVQIRHNFAEVSGIYDGTTVLTADLFNFRGSTDDFLESPSPGVLGTLVIVISAEDNEVFQKCIVVSDGIGLIRTGNYPNNNTDTDATKCSASN